MEAGAGSGDELTAGGAASEPAKAHAVSCTGVYVNAAWGDAIIQSFSHSE